MSVQKTKRSEKPAEKSDCIDCPKVRPNPPFGGVGACQTKYPWPGTCPFIGFDDGDAQTAQKQAS